MKKAYILFLLILLPVFSAYSTNISLRVIKDSIVSFINEIEDIGVESGDKLCDCLIMECRTKQDIHQNDEGIFLFSTLSPHEFAHFIIIKENDFQILNMRDKFEDNLIILLHFLEQNPEYSKEDILIYLKEFTRIYKYNHFQASRAFRGRVINRLK